MTSKIRQRGFSMIELLVVIAIILVITAMAIPNIQAALGNVRLRSTAGSMQAMIQQARVAAVKTNTFTEVRACQITTGSAVCNAAGANPNALFIDGGPYVDQTTGLVTTKNDGVAQSQEPLLPLSGGVVFDFTGTQPAFDSNANLGYAQLPSPAWGVSFNSRGLPCRDLGTTCPTRATDATLSATQQQGYLYFLKRQAPFSVSWGAISITPAGRMRVWIYNGASWK
jgi:prepilin-type N-terminal cleavage/methylation domain-containing protein